jgi:hypothetical protein
LNAESMLFLPKRRQEAHGLERVDDSVRRDTAVDPGDSVSSQEVRCGGDDKPAVRADDAVGARSVGVIDEPRRHGSSGSDIAQRTRDHAAGCDLAGSELL